MVTKHEHEPLEPLDVRCTFCGALATLMVPGDALVSEVLKSASCHKLACTGAFARAPRVA